MKKKPTSKPTASKFSLLRQLCNFIPPHRVSKLARATGVEDHARTFSPWSHVVSLLYAQLTHSLGLNDVCDALRLHSGPLSALRGATPPPKYTLSYPEPCSRGCFSYDLAGEGWSVFNCIAVWERTQNLFP
jgi:hypothetical protein